VIDFPELALEPVSPNGRLPGTDRHGIQGKGAWLISGLVITASIGSSDRAMDELSAATWERRRGPATSRMTLMRSTEGGRFCSNLRSRRDVATLYPDR
jgi:hypothetical protein